MKPVNEIKLSFPSYSSNESLARGVIATFVCPIDPTIDELSDIKTAVSEAVTNCIVHAYKDCIGEIFINAKMFDNGLVRIRIRDKGCGIPDIAKAMEPLYTTAPKSERAGLGFAVMQEFMDKIKVSSKVGSGTSITMEKRILRRHMVS